MSDSNENPEDRLQPDPLAPEPLPEEGAGGEDRVAALQKELDEAKDQMLRALADTENTRKRLLREREDIRKYAVADFARDLLDFADNFRRALSAISPEVKQSDERIAGVMAGVESMEKELLKTLEKHGVRKIEPMGEPFNANYHEALFEAPGTGKPAGTVIQIIEPGYVLHDRLLKPARVGIAKDEGQGSGEPGSRVNTQA